ncbi:MAG TPA: NAD(P)H-binding protein, partial [Humibacter sp.]|nr:NAD(P)H-binding protein [Humibacter sp.]
MRIAIIGATGRTGRLAAEYALNNGHDVTAVVRSPDKLGDLAQRVRVVQANATDLDGLTAGIRGADAVISTLGHAAEGSNRVMVDGIRTTLDAMRRADISRVSMITASGHETDGDGFFTRSIVKPILGRFLREGFDDMRLAETALRESDAAWTIVRPPML